MGSSPKTSWNCPRPRCYAHKDKKILQFLSTIFGFVREKPYFYEACCDQAEEISLYDNLLQKEVTGTTVSKQFS